MKTSKPGLGILFRIVGKFGSILFSSPSPIYKLDPPFCPNISMVRKYHEKTRKAFPLLGRSNLDGNYHHIQRLVDADYSAFRVLAIDDIFAALVLLTLQSYHLVC